jgi:metal-dependent amidase/aminoacylase/carboxypeptidase family protein
VILNGGVRANIIPDYSKLEVYLRARKFDELEPLERKVKTCFEAAGISYIYFEHYRLAAH